MATKLRDLSLINDTATREELDRFSMEVLRDYCKKNSLATGRTKEIVIQRILDHFENNEGTSKENKSLEKLSVSKKGTKSTKKTTTKDIETENKTEADTTETKEIAEAPVVSKKRGVKFHSQHEQVHVFDRIDPPSSNIYDVVDKKGISVFDDDVRTFKKSTMKDRQIRIATEGVAPAIFSLHDVAGDTEVRRDTEELTLKELKEELKRRRQPTNGTRRELIDRLDECILGHPKAKKVKKEVPSWLTWD